MQSGLIALQRIVNAKLHVDGLQALTACFCGIRQHGIDQKFFSAYPIMIVAFRSC